MCTSVFFNVGDGYFGRNLDVLYSYGEEIAVVKRNCPIHFRNEGELKNHLAIIGVGKVVNEDVLYFDAINEAGLSMAGLSFDEFAIYHEPKKNIYNVASFELISWVLGKCENIKEARELVSLSNITNQDYDENNTSTPLHWMIADKTGALVVESCKEGVKIYDNQIGVLTNSPDFEAMRNLYAGYEGIPGDYTSLSRFIKAGHIREKIKIGPGELEKVSSFYHILGAVEMQRGCVVVDGKLEETLYSSCYNLSKGILYYRTYGNVNIKNISLYDSEIDGLDIRRCCMT